MRLRTRTWFVLSLLCFMAGAYFWRLGNERVGKTDPKPAASNQTAVAQSNAAAVRPALPLAPTLPPTLTTLVNGQTNFAVTGPKSPLAYRLSNSARPVSELMRSESAMLLRNALIDSTMPVALAIPAHLRAQGDPGSYVVQSRGLLDDAFRAELQRAGAEIISYVPHNAYLVRVGEGGAQQMQASPQTLAVLAWEPYFKFDLSLLPLAVEQQPLPGERRLNLLLFPGERDATLPVLKALGVEVLAEDRSPFGHQLTVRAPEDWIALSRLPAVQSIEPYRVRTTANDLTRVRVRVATNTITPDNYLGLTGQGVVVNINDTGVDDQHPDLSPRVTGDSLTTLQDYDGHGTHVAGIIASKGPGPMVKFTTSTSTNTDGSTNTFLTSNVPGSVSNANFRGMAPAASLYALPISLVTGPTADSYLQENAARTNALISNNSWGYIGSSGYDLASASWDAAVRDSLPGLTGSQPLLYVFAAGNSGYGDDSGVTGVPDSILSPGSAKNVLTVGAIESFRNITNDTIIAGVTNQSFLGLTDSDNQVAGFSSRGNVGIGVEGTFGRFKPDVVAPGTFIISTKSRNWQAPTQSVNYIVNTIRNQVLPGNFTNLYAVYVPANGQQVSIRLVPNAKSPPNFPLLPIGARKDAVPPPNDFFTVGTVLTFTGVPGSTYYYTVGNNNAAAINLDVQTVVTIGSGDGDYFSELKKLDDGLGADYRFESGTSMAAPVVSGTLALLQEFFEQKLSPAVTNSPAMMKALLINGARTISTGYDLNTASAINHQGWGLISLTNSLPKALANGLEAGPIRLFDQSTNNALATGESRSWTVSVSDTNSQRRPLRFTLVWTDPPGNPSTGIKLVNDLDLIVTSTSADGGTTATNIYLGNHFTGGGDFTEPITVTSTNTGENAIQFDLLRDVVNNVENVYVEQAGTATYTVTVAARRVNVNAVTAHRNGVVQDFALVISSGNLGGGNVLTVTPGAPGGNRFPTLLTVTNGVPLLNQRIGANSPLLTYPGGTANTNGSTNQWRFYYFSNAGAENTNVAFVTFLPPNLSRSRLFEADIDLYVSTESGLTNLDVGAVNRAFKSRKRGGTEAVVLANQAPDTSYYVGVKSEDQQAANFGFFAFAGSQPFNNSSSNGVTMRGVPIPIAIPDGSAADPQAALVFAFSPPIKIQNVVVTNSLFHENGGDLIGNLSHDQHFAVLNNHRSFFDFQTWIYDDSDSGNIVQAIPVDGPGTLRSFVGEEGEGVWQLTMVDDSLFSTGRVENLTIYLERRQDALTNDTGIVRTILPNRWFYTTFDVPMDADSVDVCVAPDAGPVEVYLRRGDFPTRTLYDTFGIVQPGTTNCITLSRDDSPTLSSGRYYIGVYNPNSIQVTVNLKVRINRNADGHSALTFRSGTSRKVLDDAVTNSVIHITDRRQVADLNVGVRISHERASDLVLHLVSPSGTRILLAENRGGPYGADYGAGMIETRVLPTTSSGDARASTNVINLPASEGTLQVDYDFFTIPDDLRVYFEDQLIFDTGLVSDSGRLAVDFAGSATNITIVMNEGGNPDESTRWQYTATVLSGVIFATFTENTNLALVPIKFGIAPFTNNLAGLLGAGVPVSDFDSAAAGNYTTGQTFDGWTVVTGVVSVANIPPADSGAQYLVMSDGEVRRALPTLAGRQYRLEYAQRGRSCLTAWWPFEGSTSDLIGGHDGTLLGSTTFSAAKVGQGLYFFGVGPNYMKVPATPALNLGLNPGFTVEGWVKLGNPTALMPIVEWDTATTNGLCLWANTGTNLTARTGALYANVRGSDGKNHELVSTAGRLSSVEFRHVALTYEKLSGRAALYVNGLPVVTTNIGTNITAATTGDLYYGYRPVGAKRGVQFSGLMDEMALYSCALSPAGILDIVLNSAAGKCTNGACGSAAQLSVGGQTVAVLGTTNWQKSSIDFTALANDEVVDITSLVSGMQFDTFKLISLAGGANNYLPEEPLNPVRGEIAEGDWTLEVWDNRAGARLKESSVLDWRLQFTFVNTNPPTVTLTNGLCYSNHLAGGAVAYFLVNVPATAAHATNILKATDSVDLVFNQRGLPAITRFGDKFILTNTMNGLAEIGPIGTRRFNNGAFIGTLPDPKLQPGRRYYLEVRNTDPTTSSDFTICVDFDKVDPNPLNVPALVNGVCIADTIAPTNLLKYYYFDVAQCATEVIFELQNLSDDVNLVVTRGPPLPNPTTYFYRSINSGTNAEVIDIPDTPAGSFSLGGRWYVGVYNVSSNTATYCVKATQVAGDCPNTLTNGVPVTSTVPVGGMDVFQYTVSPKAYRVDFEVLSPNGNVDLYVKYAAPASPGDFDFASTNPGAADELVSVDDSTTPPVQPGVWYIAVTNLEAIMPVTYQLRVTEYLLTCVTNGLTYAGTADTSADPSGGVKYYQFMVSPDSVQVDFEVFKLTGNVDIYLGTNRPPLPGPGNFIFSSTNPGTNDERILVHLESSPPLTSGNWYMAVVNQDPTNVSFSVRVTEHPALVLTNGVSVRDLVIPAGYEPAPHVKYYCFNVPSNALLAKFEIYNPTAENLDLFVRKGLPLPSDTFYDYASTNTIAVGVTNEAVTITTNSTPVALGPGNWYMAVVNQNTNFVNYYVRAAYYTNAPPTTVTPLSACVPLTDMVAAGATNYYSLSVSDGAVQANFESFAASGDIDLFLVEGLPLPTDTSFYYASTNTSPTDEAIIVTKNSYIPLAAGDWYLAVVNREVVPVSFMLEASEFVANNSLVQLTNTLAVTSALGVGRPGDVCAADHYLFTVSPGAVQAAFSVFGVSGGTVGVYLRNSLPLPTTANGQTSVTNGGPGTETILLTIGSPPVPLSAGDYYLTVENLGGSPVNYSIVATEAVIQKLTNNVPRSGVVGPAGAAGVNYYYFDVSPGAVEARFETFAASGNVDLFVSKFPVFPTEFSRAASTNGGRTNELVTLATATPPVPLVAGRWFVAVINRDPANVTYLVRATQFFADTLTNCVAETHTLLPAGFAGSTGVDYYRFHVSPGAVQAEFATFDAAGEIDLYLVKGLPLPDDKYFYTASTNAGLADEFIRLTKGGFPALTPGDWYIAVVSRFSDSVTYSIRATEFISTKLVNGQAVTRTLAPVADMTCDGLDYYRYTVSTNPVEAFFETFGATGNVDLYLTRGLPLPTTNAFTIASITPVTGRELITLRTNTATRLTQGDWYLAVVNHALTPTTYSVRVTERNIVRLDNAIPYAASVPGSNSTAGLGLNYYVFKVSGSSVRAQFEALAPDSNVTLLARKGALPVVGPPQFDAISANAGNSPELIELFAGGAPVALTPGDWFLTVVNSNAAPANYAAKATEFDQAGTNFTVGVAVTTNGLCFTWAALPNVNYHVEAKVWIDDPAWTTISPTIRATSTNITWCVPLPPPGNYHFFRIVGGLGLPGPVFEPSPPSPVITPAFLLGSGVRLLWTAAPGLTFQVLWATDIAGPWMAIPDIIISSTWNYTWFDDGSQTGGTGVSHFYRLQWVP